MAVRDGSGRGEKIGAQAVPNLTRRERFAEVERAANVGATLWRIVSYFAREKALVAALLAVVLLATVCGVVAPSLQSRVVDIIAGEGAGELVPTLGAMLAVYALYSAAQLLQNLVSARLSQGIVRRMRQELFSKLMDLPVRYLDTHSHGDVMSRMTNDVENISTTVSQSLPSLVSGVLTVAGTVAVMVWYCWQLALLSCATVVLTIAATRVLSARVRRYSRRRQALLGRLNGIVEEMVSGYRTLTACNHQDAAVAGFCATADELTAAGIRTDVFSGVMGPIMNCIGNVGFVIIAAFGGYFSATGLISVGVISAFIVYAKQFSRPINEIAQVYGQLQTAVAGAERVFAVFDEPDEDMAGEPLGVLDAPDVTFERVCFSYDGTRPTIEDLTLRVAPGRKVALVGATGSGKTTVVNLLMRFYDVGSGTICVGGRDIARVARASLRSEVAIVLQDTVLFSDTVRANLAYGRPDATDEEMWAALEASHCAGLVRSWPEGLDHVLAGAGEGVSQGQRQLLAIARAFVADPRILILDEATSNVDTRTEQAIQDAMRRVMRNRTSIVIAHRLSTVRDSDLIVVMDRGHVVEEGTHDELIARGGRYHDLYMTQFVGLST